MTGKPKSLVQLDDTVNHLRATLRKHKNVVPPSLAAMICGFLSRWGRAVQEGKVAIDPGRDQIAKWSGCGDRQAGYNLAVLRNWRFLEEVAHGQGGRHRPTVYTLNFMALIWALRLSGVKLHPTLVDKLHVQARKAAKKGSRNGGNGCSLSYDNPLISQGNDVASLYNRGSAAHVAWITPLDDVPQGQETGQGVETQVTPPLDSTPMLYPGNQPRDLSPHTGEALLAQPEEVPTREWMSGEVVNLNARRASRGRRLASDPTPGGNDATEPFVGPPEDHGTGGHDPHGERRVGRHE